MTILLVYPFLCAYFPLIPCFPLSNTVCIQHCFVHFRCIALADRQTSFLTKCLSQFFHYPAGTMHIYYNLVDYIWWADLLYTPVTVL